MPREMNELLALAIGILLTIGLVATINHFWEGPKPTEAQTEEWTPYPIETYEIPLDTGQGHILRMYNPNGVVTCYSWVPRREVFLPIGCVAGNR